MTLISHSRGLITDEELLLKLEENTSRNSDFFYDALDRFDLENMEAEWKWQFRVEIHLGTASDLLTVPFRQSAGGTKTRELFIMDVVPRSTMNTNGETEN